MYAVQVNLNKKLNNLKLKQNSIDSMPNKRKLFIL